MGGGTAAESTGAGSPVGAAGVAWPSCGEGPRSRGGALRSRPRRIRANFRLELVNHGLRLSTVPTMRKNQN